MSLFNELRNTILNKITTKSPLNHAEKTVHDMYSEYLIKCAFDQTSIINMNDVHNLIQSTLIKNKNYIIKLLFDDNTCIYINYKILNEIELFNNMLELYEFGNECVTEIVVGKEINNFTFISFIYEFTMNGIYTKMSMTYQEFYDLVCIINYMGLITYKDNNILNYIVYNDIKRIHSSENITLEMVDKLHTIFVQNNANNYGNVLSLFMDAVNINEIDIPVLKNMNLFNDVLSGCTYENTVIRHKLFTEFVSIYNETNAEKIVSCLLNENTIECWTIIMELNKFKHIFDVNNYLIVHLNKITDIVLNFNIDLFSLPLRLKLYEKFNKNEAMYNMFNNAIENNDVPYMVKEIPIVLNTFKHGDGDTFRKLNNISCIDKFTNNRENITQLLHFMPLSYKKWTCIGKVYEVDSNTIKIKMKKIKTLYVNDVLLINCKLNVPYNTCTITQIITQTNLDYHIMIDKSVEINDNVYI